jgi:hypothetical protein
MRLAFLSILAITPAWSQDAVDIIRKSIEHDRSNFERRKDYTYVEREETRELDSNGKPRKTESNTHEILILAGRPYEHLIARNDQPLSPEETRKQQERMDQALARRQNESEKERENREKEREENRKFLRELPEAYNFRLLGVENVSGKPAWVIDAAPRPGFHPKDTMAKLLTKVRGKVWIDQAEYQWVKADAEVLDTISFGLALFRLSAGGTISFEQSRINDEVWLPAHVHVRADARVAYLKKYRADVDVTYRDYKKFQADSHLVSEAK